MKGRSSHNRAICAGDQGRFGPDRQTRGSIIATISKWSTPFIEKFIPTASSLPWRSAAQEILEARLLPKTKKVRKNQRRRAPKTSGHRVSEPAQPAAALSGVGY